MQAAAGDAQVGTVGAVLPTPISVEVTTKSGRAVVGAAVDWSFTNGTGSSSLDSTGSRTLTTVTDKSGEASVYWTLDTIAGDQEATATLRNASSFKTTFHSRGKASRPDSIDISPSSVILAVGQPVLFRARVFDKWHNLISDATVAWHSDDPVVAVVDSTGMVTGEAPGADTIVARDGSASGESFIRVASSSPSVAKVTADSQTVTLAALGATAQLSATATDASGATVQGAPFNWTTLNSAVATVDSIGLVTAVKNGTTSVVVSAVGSAAADTVAVTVSQQASKMTLAPDSLDLRVGQTSQLTATVTDKNGNKITGANVAWASSDSSVASVDQSGQVSAHSAGTATVSASSGGIKAQVPVNVSAAAPAVSSVVLTPDSLSFTALGATATLTAKALNSLGNQVSGASISWSSSNPAVASVDQGGLVTSKGWGQAFIVATAVCCSVSDTAAVTVQQPTTGVQDTSGYYGEVWQADGLANLEIGKASGREISYRFRADHTGLVNQIRVFFVYRSGYAAGNGGEVRVELQTDDGSSGHYPSGQVLGSALVTDPMASNFRTIQFTQPISVSQGQIYHLVFTDPASDPVANYVSIDDLYDASRTPNMQPTISDTDFAVVWKSQSGSSWAVNYGHTPVVDIFYSDGFVQGQGYVDAKVSSPLSVSGSQKARELITVQGGDKLVTSVSVRMRSVAGNGQATVQLQDAGGSVIEQGTVTVGSSYGWSTLRFQTAHQLLSGSTYAVVVSAPSGNQFQIYALQEGPGFASPTIFTDGRAQYSSGSSWSDAYSSSAMDFQLFFTLGG